MTDDEYHTRYTALVQQALATPPRCTVCTRLVPVTIGGVCRVCGETP